MSLETSNIDNSVLYRIVSHERLDSRIGDYLFSQKIMYTVIASIKMSDWVTLIRVYGDHKEAMTKFVLSEPLISFNPTRESFLSDSFY